jgi:hypothetical protein
VSYETARLDDLESQRGMIPIRRRFGIRAFGVNAWRADEAGATVIAERDEKDWGHQELYTVVSGHATFTVDGDEIDAPAGTLVAITGPDVTRKAIAKAAGTTVLAIGAPSGATFEPDEDLGERSERRRTARALRCRVARRRSPRRSQSSELRRPCPSRTGHGARTPCTRGR